MIDHEISDALTNNEARAVCALLLIAVEQHDRRKNTRKLLNDIRIAAQLAEKLAYSVPDDSDWPNYGHVDMPRLSGERNTIRN